MQMLDDLNSIAQKDPYDALGVAAKGPEQLLYSDFEFDPAKFTKIENVVLAGMGGSALAGLICKTWWFERLNIPFEIVRGYNLPAYVGKNTLVIASSYSGNTEETVNCLDEAKQRGAQIIVMAAGGKLQELANQGSYPFLKLPSDYQPRMTTGFGVKILATVFEELGLVQNALSELEQAQAFLKGVPAHYAKEVKTDANPAKQLAQELMGRVVWVYSGPMLSPAAYKWKINFNENAKNVAVWNEFPELNHNELIGWTSHPVEKPFGIVELRSKLDHPRVQKRFEVTNKLLSGKMPKPFEVEAQGKIKIEQILWSILLGDFVSIYLALLNGVNPTPVEVVEKLKKELG
jgi:glucose/mannose-6-phosphate isomerase